MTEAKREWPEPVTLQIEKLAQGGLGLGRYGGRTVFVPFTAPGETVTVRLYRQKSDYDEGVIETIVTPSPTRRTPPCPLFGICGGCQLQHMTETAQVKYKAEALAEALARIGKIQTANVLPMVASPESLGYRRRARLTVQKGRIGFLRRQSHQVVPVSHCPLLVPALNETLAAIEKGLPLAGLDEIELQAGGGVLVVLRGGKFTPHVARAFFEAHQPLLRGVVLYTLEGRCCFGIDHLIYPYQERTIQVSDRAFVQVNGLVNQLMIEHLLRQVSPTETVLELHSGTGNFTLPLARRVATVTAVEGNPMAVEDARRNLRGLSNVTLIRAPVAEAMERMLPETFTRVVLDPPREGAAVMLPHLLRLKPTAISYLSCNPATFARDAGLLCQNGYRLQAVQPFDLMPQTGQTELLAELVIAERMSPTLAIPKATPATS